MIYEIFAQLLLREGFFLTLDDVYLFVKNCEKAEEEYKHDPRDAIAVVIDGTFKDDKEKVYKIYNDFLSTIVDISTNLSIQEAFTLYDNLKMNDKLTLSRAALSLYIKIFAMIESARRLTNYLPLLQKLFHIPEKRIMSLIGELVVAKLIEIKDNEIVLR